ncbi:MAG: glycosyltransferase family 2 protein [Candidatus Diapherotrites archaeon]|nr:glycosyltransferase family 2 protein [Candidatus Diapherotrites archaeon]
MKKERLSIIIPAYNEEATIGRIVEKVRKVNLAGLGAEKEIIVVDDGSRDRTAEIAKKIPGIKFYSNKKNLGKGGAVQAGIKNATGGIILIQDADLEYFPEEIPLLLKPILDGKASVVYGSRFLGTMRGKQLLSHTFGNKFLSLMTTVLFLHGMTDMETAYKMFRKEALDGVRLRERRFEFEPEITAKILKRGNKILEVPITFEARTFEEGKKITVWDGIKSGIALFRYRFFD